MIKKVLFKNIVFTNLKKKDFSKIINKKGYFVFPAAPALASIENSKNYYKSLVDADYVFFDSGFFVILLRFFKNIYVDKFSGYKFLNHFFLYLRKNKNKSILLIDPNYNYSKSNKNLLSNIGVKNVCNYVAPKYSKKKILDNKLLTKINKFKPNYIIINLGGGTQEILAFYLKKKLKNKYTIFCTGGAISFFTGDQAPINYMIDKLYLGWLYRIIFNPVVFFKRYISAIKLISIVKKNKIKTN